MVEAINFLRHRRRELTKRDLTDRLLFRYSLLSFGIVAVIAVAALGAQLLLKFRVQQAKTQETNLKKDVLSQEDIERSYIVFAHKLKILQDLFAERSDKQAAIAFFSQLFGPNVLINEISYEADQATLGFGLKARDVFTLKQVFALLDSDQVKTTYKGVTRSDLRRDLDGAYQMRVTVSLSEGDKKK